MDENKVNDFDNEAEEFVASEEGGAAQPEEAVNPERPKKIRKEKAPKEKKPKRLKNQLLWKRGGYSIAITAIFIAAVILVNVLIGLLTDRFHLEFDVSTEKVNTISDENIEYLKNIDRDVTITFCASEDYYSSYMSNYFQSQHGIYDDYSNYYDQTVSLVNKYHEYNKKINVRFVDMYNDVEFDAVSQKYSNENIQYGDIIVSTVVDANGESTERYKVIGFEDIYDITTDSNSYYSMMGYSSSTITGNNIETALTSAIAYVLGSDTKKVVILSGHSSSATSNYEEAYAKLLRDNTFEVELLDSVPVMSIPEDTDVLVLIAPVTDLLTTEVDTIVDFLENDGNYGKGLIYFGTAATPNLPNLYELLADWNIYVQDGKVFMTDDDYCISGDHFSIVTPIGYTGYYFVSSSNQPILAEDSSSDSFTVNTLDTVSSSVIAPIEAGNDWGGYTSDDLNSYALVAQATKTTYNDENEKVSSMVVAISSLDFISSEWAEQQSVYNKNITLLMSQEAIQAEDTGISFVSKSITNESYSSQVTESGSNVVKVIFMILLPVGLIVAAVFVYNRRKNAV